MSRKLQATLVILGSFLAWVVVELVFNGDKDQDTPTITQLVVENLHPELVVFLASGFGGWIIYHFAARAWRKQTSKGGSS